MINKYSCINIYENRKKNSKLSSQILYGEKFSIIKKYKDFCKIKTDYDKYVGFIKKRKFEQLISTKHLTNLDLNNEYSNIFKKIWDVFSEWDEMLNLKNFKTFIYPYKSFKENGDYTLSMKRISIHKENYKTSEITVPISEDRPSYLVERSCDGIIQYFFEKKHNRKLS